MATILRDNNLATIIGEPSGGKPSSYGNPVEFFTPNYKIKFNVSTQSFTRPNKNIKNECSLYPNILVHPTINNILTMEDVVLDRSIKLFLGDY